MDSARRQEVWDYVACPFAKRHMLDAWLSSRESDIG
jgi:hypothetical protein